MVRRILPPLLYLGAILELELGLGPGMELGPLLGLGTIVELGTLVGVSSSIVIRSLSSAYFSTAVRRYRGRQIFVRYEDGLRALWRQSSRFDVDISFGHRSIRCRFVPARVS